MFLIDVGEREGVGERKEWRGEVERWECGVRSVGDVTWFVCLFFIAEEELAGDCFKVG